MSEKLKQSDYINRYYVRYRAEDGEIFGWGNTFGDVEPMGLEVAYLDKPWAGDNLNFKIDVATKKIKEKNAEEKRQSLLPKDREVEEAVFKELCGTDSMVIPDRPMDQATRKQWTDYRQALRDLSKIPNANAADRVKAWPARPDGAEVVKDLKERANK